ncbi:MAG: esterase-like activity of phytase family protein [Pseudomonadota bacterium]
MTPFSTRTALIAALLAACASCSTKAAGPAGTPELKIHASKADVRPTRAKGLTWRSAVELQADHDGFGGFSGLHITDGHMVAVTDAGWWLLADLKTTPDGLVPGRAGFLPMRGSDGETFNKSGGDAEALTTRDGRLVVAFERDHRIMFHDIEEKLRGVIRDRLFENLGSNKGIEALATTPDGWLLAIAEGDAGAAAPVFRVKYSGEVTARVLPLVGDHRVTGADVGPDGRLYVLRRRYAPITGVSIIVERFHLDDEGFPLPKTREELAFFDSLTGIDNMEGLAVWTDSAGTTRLTLIADDNFNILQRTLLIDFEIN